jgi:hypothetical protein
MAGLAAAAALLSAATVGEGAQSPPVPVAAYYLARADPRLCPSPQCGGLFVHLANRWRTVCGDGLRRPSCYVAAIDLGRLGVSDARRVQLLGSISAGRALVRGVVVRGGVTGFPQLDTLVASEVWLASSSPHAPTGTFRRLRDNGIRCIAAPCFSTDALVLNARLPGAHATVSVVETPDGAKDAEVRRATRLVASGRVIGVGRIVAVPDAGPAGTGRAFIASQFYTPAG